MLITTSRKPSKRTRSFCQYLTRVFDSEYFNRGKMSMHDIFLKLHNSKYLYILVVYELNGNPSKMTFFNKESKECASFLINVSLPNKRININKNNLSFKSDVNSLSFIKNFLGSFSENFESNVIWIKNCDGFEGVLEVFDNESQFTGFKIFIKKHMHYLIY